jgi:hypothetical protein
VSKTRTAKKEPKTRVCKKCGVRKLVDKFKKNPRCRIYVCKRCCNAKARKRAAELCGRPEGPTRRPLKPDRKTIVCCRCACRRAVCEFDRAKGRPLTTCKKCRRQYRREQHAKKALAAGRVVVPRYPRKPPGKTMVCRTCRRRRPTGLFALKWSHGKKVHRNRDCKKCESEKTRRRNEKNRERRRQLQAVYYWSDPEGKRRANALDVENSYRRGLKKKYGVSFGWFDDQMKSQGYRCECCRIKIQRKSGYVGKHPNKACVDHDHVTNTVRGILCPNCNLAIGYSFDNPTSLRKMASYLIRHNVPASGRRRASLLRARNRK